MVYRKRSRKKRSFKKRSFKKRYRRKSRIGRQLVPNRCAKTLNYSTTITLNPPASTVPGGHLFSMNGVWDPDVTGLLTGHQPMGFDQYCPTLYTHYTCVGFKIKATFISTKYSGSATGGDTAAMARVGITPTGRTSSISGSTDQIIERGRSKHSLLTSQGQKGTTTVSYAVNPNKYLGISNPLGNATIKGTSAANPSEQAYVWVWAGPVNDTDDPLPIQVLVNITYKVVFSEPRWLNGS